MVFLLSDVICSKNSTFCKSSHNLIICKKSSVAKSIASALGVTSSADGYFEGGGWLISWYNGITTYVLSDNYYLPALKLPEDKRSIGCWGRLHRLHKEYLKITALSFINRFFYPGGCIPFWPT